MEFFGTIPSEWNVTALKRVLSEPLKYGAVEPGDDSDPSNPRYLRITDFDGDGSLRDDTFVSLPEEIARHYYLRDGDVLFARSGATVGKTFLFRNYSGRACFAGYLIKASTARHKLTPEFLTYFTRSPAYDAWKDSIFTQATIQNIGADKYARLPICLPPLPEQERIAAYLDASCAAVDAAVAAKRRQLDTLETLRKATLHAAFAKESWPVERIKDVAMRIGSGVTPDGGAAGYLDEGIPLLRSQNVHFDGLRLDDVAFISKERLTRKWQAANSNHETYFSTLRARPLADALLFLKTLDKETLTSTFASSESIISWTIAFLLHSFPRHWGKVRCFRRSPEHRGRD